MAERKIVLFGALGAGAYLAYEYMQYSKEMSTVSALTANSVAALESLLPFITYVAMKWGIGTVDPNSPVVTQAQKQQQLVFNAMTGAPAAPAQAPGTTSPSQPTSVSKAPTTTPTVPTTVTTAPTASFQLVSTPVHDINYSLKATVLINGQSMTLNVIPGAGTIWNSSGANITAALKAQGVDTGALINAFVVAGPPISKGVSGKAGTSGVGAIARFPVPTLNTIGNLLYQAHHQLPYAPSYMLRGLGAVTQATGFEKVLYSNMPLRSNRTR